MGRRSPAGFPLAASLVLALAGGVGAAPPVKPPKIPAHVSVAVSPETVPAGGRAEVTVKLDPIPGVKINRYPQVKLAVPALKGLVQEAEVAVGNSSAPPPDKLTDNYFEHLEPLSLTLSFEEAAPPGQHEIAAKLTYFYCMPASGFCAPHRTEVTIPVSVR